MPHKFKVGDMVVINPAISRFVPGGVFQVIKRLPGNGEPGYRVKSARNRMSASCEKTSSPMHKEPARVRRVRNASHGTGT
jgi:hypothetical protein